MTMEEPELLPARMLNQYTYCPRLFYLEWVNGEWASSGATAAGDFDHRAIATPSGPCRNRTSRGHGPWPVRLPSQIRVGG